MRLTFRGGRKQIYLIVFIGVFSVSSLSSTGYAHPVIYSEYSLSYMGDQWILSFNQKTSYLRDAIYASRPDLKGINLNSEIFLKETSRYIASNLMLKYDGEHLQIAPQRMKYGGLRFESSFAVEGLPGEPDYLAIKADGFDVHEHSIIVFKVSIGADGYLNYFNRDQNLATFDFAKYSYVFGEIERSGDYSVTIYALSFVLITGLLGWFLKRKQLLKTSR